MKKTADEIRNMFLNFFVQKNHKIVKGSSLVPNNDSTLLFTNAGMNQFKNVFLGKTDTNKFQIVTSQNCLRTGGKHNDLNNVGNTPYHHTFFEMLGNFSFNSYFKKESILYAWELLTSNKWFGLDKNKLIVTVHNYDQETYDIWKNIIKIPSHSILKVGHPKTFAENCDNFWQMGETGPCGPSTEIFFNQTNFPNDKLLINTQILNTQCLEIWNIVFIQFNRIKNKSLIPLSICSVDTGMGLERITSIIQKVSSNYEIDIFQILIQKILSLTPCTNPSIKSLRIISDHIRASAFIISEDILPSNEKRGYVLRKIIRRAIRHGIQLNITTPFLYKLIPNLIKSMGSQALHLKKNVIKIQQVIKKEEENFIITLNKGLKQLNSKFKYVQNNILDGKTIFYIYDTFGLPISLIQFFSKKNYIDIDMLGFHKEMQNQKNRSINNSTFAIHNNDYFITNHSSVFLGYELKEITGNVQSIYKNQKKNNKLVCGELGAIILDQTALYGESGGQVGDSGELYNSNAIFKVYNSKKYMNAIIHEGIVNKGEICINDQLISKVNTKRRLLIQANHTATHLLQASLRKILGTGVVQKGSFISDKYLRFDFSYNDIIPPNLLYKIELLVNEQIQKNICIKTQEMSLKKSFTYEIIRLSDKKYKNKVRVVSIDDFSHELCGGTHSLRSGDIGVFKIHLNPTKISSGVYRIHALTGKLAILNIHEQLKALNSISILLKTQKSNVIQCIDNLINRVYVLEKKILEVESENNSNLLHKIENKIILIKEVKIIIHVLKNKDATLLRCLTDKLKNKLKKSITILVNITNKNIFVVVGVTKNLIDKITAIELITMLTKNFNGKGGGKNELAEGGGKNIKNINVFLKKILSWINNRL